MMYYLGEASNFIGEKVNKSKEMNEMFDLLLEENGIVRAAQVQRFLHLPIFL